MPVTGFVTGPSLVNIFEYSVRHHSCQAVSNSDESRGAQLASGVDVKVDRSQFAVTFFLSI